LQPVPFDQTIARVVSGEFEAAVVIHEGQLTFAEAGLHLVLDLGAWWRERSGLPLPLGLNVIRRDIDDRFGAGSTRRIGEILRRSVKHALAHRSAAVEHARAFGRGISHAQADEFIRLYVNDLTIDCRPLGEEAIRRLLIEGHRAGLLPAPAAIDVL
jgi:1,4-dihydroxy-6-naphthoate synthase